MAGVASSLEEMRRRLIDLERAHAASLGKTLSVGMVLSKDRPPEMVCIHGPKCQFRSTHVVSRSEGCTGTTYAFALQAHHTCHDLAPPKIVARTAAFGLQVSDFEDHMARTLRPSMSLNEIMLAVGHPKPSMTCADRIADMVRWRETEDSLGACLRHISSTTGCVTALDTAVNARGRRMIYRSAWVVAKTPHNSPPAVAAGDAVPYVIGPASLLYLEFVHHTQSSHGTYVCLGDASTMKLIAVGHLVVENADSLQWFLETVMAVVGGRGSGAMVSFCGNGARFKSVARDLGMNVGPHAPWLKTRFLERLTGYAEADVVQVYPAGIYAAGLMQGGARLCAPAFMRMLRLTRPDDRAADALQVMYVRQKGALANSVGFGRGGVHSVCAQCGLAGHVAVQCDNIVTAAVARSSATFGPGESGEWRTGPPTFNFTPLSLRTYAVAFSAQLPEPESGRSPTPAPGETAAVRSVVSPPGTGAAVPVAGSPTTAPKQHPAEPHAPVGLAAREVALVQQVVGGLLRDDGHDDYYSTDFVDESLRLAEASLPDGTVSLDSADILVAKAVYDLKYANVSLPADLEAPAPELLQDLDPFGFESGPDYMCSDSPAPKRRRVVPGSSLASVFSLSQ